jgi:hypothetical protein
MERSAEPLPTAVVAVAVLLPGVGSVVAAVTVAVFVMIEPSVSEALVAMVNVKLSVRTGRLAMEQVIVPAAPTAGVVQDHPAAAESETNVVDAGSVSDQLTVFATLVPLFVTSMLYAMFVPAITGSGASLFVIARSADVLTVVVEVALSLPEAGSLVVVLAVAVLAMMVPAAIPGSIATTSVKTALPGASVAMEQFTVPPAPTAGVVQDQPPGDVSETNVVPAGRVSDHAVFAAALGPALPIVMV